MRNLGKTDQKGGMGEEGERGRGRGRRGGGEELEEEKEEEMEEDNDHENDNKETHIIKNRNIEGIITIDPGDTYIILQ